MKIWSLEWKYIIFTGKDKEIQQFRGGCGRGGRLTRTEAKDFILGEQSGTTDESAQAVGAWQCRPALRSAQAWETSASHNGTC